jgi:hypothetical protein
MVSDDFSVWNLTWLENLEHPACLATYIDGNRRMFVAVGHKDKKNIRVGYFDLETMEMGWEENKYIQQVRNLLRHLVSLWFFPLYKCLNRIMFILRTTRERVPLWLS